MSIIHIIMASRGDYSDRSEYPVCWFETKERAEAAALVMNQRSGEKLADAVGKLCVQRRGVAS